MGDDKDRQFWLTVIKVAAGVIVLVVLFVAGLYYTARFQTYAPPEASPAPDWGISKDSPIRKNR